jgi:hypothetical protein
MTANAADTPNFPTFDKTTVTQYKAEDKNIFPRL